MKKSKYKALISKSTLQGAAAGVILATLIILISLDAPALAETDKSLTTLFSLFPALWAVLLLPFILAIAGYFLANKFMLVINKQANKIKKEANKTNMVLAFIENLRQDKLDEPFGNVKKSDPLSNALLNLREFMIKSKKEQEKRRIEEEQRTWVTQGLAQFGEILRKSSNNLEDISYSIIRYLVTYMKVNQGGVFLLNETKKGDKYFEMTACVAFDRRKYADKTINWGEGLIGRCGLEKETIFLTDVPDDYINITSGLGESNPGTILLVPLKTNNELFGVIELASFQILQQFEIELVEKSAESIASTISAVKTNIQTNKLLSETQMQAEKMAQQEEELRQNLEEMRATQEESDRREIERKGILDAIDHAAISCEFDIEGNLLSVNKNFLSTFKYKPEEVEGQNLKIFFFKDDVSELDRILADLSSGQNFRGRVKRRTKAGEEIYLFSTYSPVMDHNGEILKIISLENDITEQVEMEEALKRSKDELGLMLEEARNEVKEQFKEMEAVKIRNEKTLEGALDAIITTNQDGVVEFFNAAAEKLWGYERSEVLGNHANMLFSKETAKTNEFVTAFLNKESQKIVGERREIPIRNKYAEDIPVLMLLSEAQLGEESSYTAFIQNVEVELF
ncbi:PAS domain S-box protein [Alkalitalea saponilacus]|uniref:PAS domain S-box-containing protein n=1 Tax=Alkalitalea saponilacus TaxID=889453 RepID=A0A1T5EC74_9BACT|nr:PAS domain S-box protein [Alkalitalea saponilacus]ASB49036.1 histidine kinase [Alkalitalea saponilacus]SKB81554.1 PAS domain S-box-containing protein [Alkalitalea saponilacus]